MFSTLYILVGPSGSGKSTWAEMNKDRLNAVVVSTDEIRKKINGDESDQSNADRVFDMAYKITKDLLLNQKNVIFDATNTKKKYRDILIRECVPFGADVKYVVFQKTLKDCVLNQLKRDRQVPEDIIRRQYYSMDISDIDNKDIYKIIRGEW